MATNTLLSSTTQSLLFPHSNPNPKFLSTSFHGPSLKISPKSLSLSAAPYKPLTVVAATKKAVAVLKGTSAVEGVVTLTQDDDGILFFCVYVLIEVCICIELVIVLGSFVL